MTYHTIKNLEVNPKKLQLYDSNDMIFWKKLQTQYKAQCLLGIRGDSGRGRWDE